MSFFSKAFIINGMENYNFDIQEELKKLPAKPGVYIMHDERDHIIYVGKAISLKNRVRQYFQTSRNKGVKIEQMGSEMCIRDRRISADLSTLSQIQNWRHWYWNAI